MTVTRRIVENRATGSISGFQTYDCPRCGKQAIRGMNDTDPRFGLVVYAGERTLVVHLDCVVNGDEWMF